MTTIEDIPKEIWEIHVDAAKWMGKKLERLFFDKDLPALWNPPLKDSYSSGSILRLLINNKFGKELTVEVGKNKLELVPELKLDKVEIKQGIRKLKDSSNFNGTPLKYIDPSHQHPFMFLECFYRDTNGKLVSVIPDISRLPVPIPVDDSKPEVELTIKATGLEEKKVNFLWQTMTKQAKFLRFLEWQKDMIYGPEGGNYGASGSFVNKKAWGPSWNGKVLRVSATGVNDHAIVCSPLVSLFLAYWLNYNEYYTPRSGGHRTAYSKDTRAIWTTKLGGKRVKINGYRPFLKEISNPKRSRELDWTWMEFWDDVLSDVTKTKPGDIFVCAMDGHSFLIVKFGEEFTFPKAYIFGGSDNSNCEEGIYIIQANGPSGGKGILLHTYKNNDKGIEELEELINKYKSQGKTKTEAGVTSEKIAENLEKALKKMKQLGKKCEKIKVFNGTKLSTMNGKLEIEEVKKKKKVYFDLGWENKNGKPHRFSWKFRVWKIKDVLNDNGVLREDLKDGFPTTFWRGKEEKHGVDLTTHDCRPIINKM